MLWKCEDRGCFNTLKRPKLEMFADCFPGRINFGDVDAEVEIRGHFLQLEFKGYEGKFPGEVPKGQQIKFANYTKNNGFIVVVVDGDAETMEVSHIQIWKNGRTKGWQKCGFDELKRRIRKWAELVRTGKYK